MSGITNSKTGIKKILMLIDEIKGLNSDSIPKLVEKPNKLLESVEAFETEKNENLKTIETNTDEINSLKTKISQNDRDIIKLVDEIKDLNIKKQDFLDKIQEVQNKLTEVQENIKTKKEEYESRSQRLKELDNTISILKVEQEKFDEKLNALQKELEGNYMKRKNYVDSYINRVAAMNLLIRKDYIQSAQIKLIKALQLDSTLDLKSILIAIDMREDKARQVLKKMVEENAPIKYDEQAGTVTLLEEVDFK
ncbi:MAG: hypothetical protein KGD57_04570 [Candidatus Lokiarchaeota archaeon]|nr:hypothetical protein [Candidatus Lokiarchaeota archaeon]